MMAGQVYVSESWLIFELSFVRCMCLVFLAKVLTKLEHSVHFAAQIAALAVGSTGLLEHCVCKIGLLKFSNQLFVLHVQLCNTTMHMALKNCLTRVSGVFEGKL